MNSPRNMGALLAGVVIVIIYLGFVLHAMATAAWVSSGPAILGSIASIILAPTGLALLTTGCENAPDLAMLLVQRKKVQPSSTERTVANWYKVNSTGVVERFFGIGYDLLLSALSLEIVFFLPIWLSVPNLSSQHLAKQGNVTFLIVLNFVFLGVLFFLTIVKSFALVNLEGDKKSDGCDPLVSTCTIVSGAIGFLAVMQAFAIFAVG